MKLKLPEHVHGYINRHGNAVYYYRRPGSRKIRLRGLAWSPEFMAAYEAAKAGDAPKLQLGAAKTLPGSVNSALVSYYQCDAFTQGLAQSTRTNRRSILERFREAHGDKRIAMIHRPAIQGILKGKTPAAARNWRRALRGLIDHCLAMGFVTADPLVGLEKIKLKSKPHHPWETEECELFERAYPLGTRERLAYELLLQAGQARCDMVRMGRQHVRAGMLSMKRQKTDVQFHVQVTPRLQAAIDGMPATNQLTFLLTEKNEPFASAASFGNWFRQKCRDAHMPTRCTPHGLRAAAATYFAEKGATDHELMAWFGWTTISQAQVYTASANRKRMAVNAARLISGTGIGSPIDTVSQINDQPIEKHRGGK